MAKEKYKYEKGLIRICEEGVRYAQKTKDELDTLSFKDFLERQRQKMACSGELLDQIWDAGSHPSDSVDGLIIRNSHSLAEKMCVSGSEEECRDTLEKEIRLQEWAAKRIRDSIQMKEDGLTFF